ncbi:MAG: murein biosynthesis integral membrane protein MurJ [Parcubacteria group bacterium]
MRSTLLKTLLNRKTLLMGSGVLAFTTILSYILGLFRDRLLATTFGATRILDTYNASFVLPDLILNIFVAGALSAAFIPIFSQLLQKEDCEQMSEFMSSVLTSALIVVFVVGSLVFIFAPQLSNFIVPGFSDAERSLYTSLTRILLLSPLLFAVSNTLGGILVSKEKFFWFGISAPLYNLGIIGGIAFLSSQYGIFGAAYGALAGALLHTLIRLPGIVRSGLRYRPRIRVTDYYKKFLRLMTPKMIGHPLEQITFLGYTIIASSLGAGSIAILTFARNFQYAPIAIIGINLALTIFPTLSREAASGDRKAFLSSLFFTLKTIIVTTGLSAIAIYIARFWLVGLLLGGGEFGTDAVALTASALGIFTLAIPTESVNQLLARAFYSLQNSVTPVVIGIIGLIIAIGTGYIFSRTMGVNGLILGFFIGSVIKVLLLSILLKKEIRQKLSS